MLHSTQVREGTSNSRAHHPLNSGEAQQVGGTGIAMQVPGRKLPAAALGLGPMLAAPIRYWLRSSVSPATTVGVTLQNVRAPAKQLLTNDKQCY